MPTDTVKVGVLAEGSSFCLISGAGPYRFVHRDIYSVHAVNLEGIFVRIDESTNVLPIEEEYVNKLVPLCELNFGESFCTVNGNKYIFSDVIGLTGVVEDFVGEYHAMSLDEYVYAMHQPEPLPEPEKSPEETETFWNVLYKNSL